MSEPNAASLDPRRAEAIRDLIASTDHLGRVSGREPWREVLLWLTRGRWGRRPGWPVVPRLTTPWQDTVSGERPGWRKPKRITSSRDAVRRAGGGGAGPHPPRRGPGRTQGGVMRVAAALSGCLGAEV